MQNHIKITFSIKDMKKTILTLLIILPVVFALNETNTTDVNETLDSEFNESVEINQTELNETPEVNETDIENETIDINQTEINYTSEINETQLQNNETEETESEEDEEECDISLEINTPKIIYSNGEKISIKHKLNDRSYDYKIEYWIEDAFGKIMKAKRNSSNTNSKSYTPKISQKEKALIIKSYVWIEDCFDTDVSNNYFEKAVVVVDENYTTPECNCSINENNDTNEDEKQTTAGKRGGSSTKTIIASFYTRTRKFEEGKIITLNGRLDEKGVNAKIIYKNQTINLSIINESFKQNVTLEAGNNSYILVIEKDGKQIENKTLSFMVNTTIPTTMTSSEPISDEAIAEDSENVIKQNKLLLEQGYDSSSSKSKKIAGYVMLGLSALLNIVLIWKR